MTNRILGTEPVCKIASSMVQLKRDETLGQISQDTYGKPDFWPLIAAINLDRGYYDFHKTTADTLISSGMFMEVWKVSRFYNETTTTIIQLSGPVISQANEELLQRARSGVVPDISALQDEYKAQELDLVYGPAQTDDLQTIRELAIKYYGNAKFWPILVWINPKTLPGASESSPIPKEKQLYVLHFLP